MILCPNSSPFLGGVSIDPGLRTDMSDTLHGAEARIERDDSGWLSSRTGETIWWRPQLFRHPRGVGWDERDDDAARSDRTWKSKSGGRIEEVEKWRILKCEGPGGGARGGGKGQGTDRNGLCRRTPRDRGGKPRVINETNTLRQPSKTIDRVRE